MVRGSPRHSESNGGVERVNQTVQKKLGAWMKENKTKHWSIGCKIVQWRYNTQVHQTLRDTPYHLTFGQHPRVGISNLPLSSEILKNLATEAELNDVYSGIQCGMINDSFSAPMADPTFQAYAYGVWMDTNSRMHTGICASLYAYGDFSVTPRMHNEVVRIREIKSCITVCVSSHTGIAVCIWGSPYAYGQGSLKNSHMGIPLRIMKLCAYGD